MKCAILVATREQEAFDLSLILLALQEREVRERIHKQTVKLLTAARSKSRNPSTGTVELCYDYVTAANYPILQIQPHSAGSCPSTIQPEMSLLPTGPPQAKSCFSITGTHKDIYRQSASRSTQHDMCRCVCYCWEQSQNLKQHCYRGWLFSG